MIKDVSKENNAFFLHVLKLCVTAYLY